MARYGYARVSSSDQSLAVQEERLRATGCDVVRGEHASGASRDGRSELALLLQFICPGDSLVVTRIDRLARGVADLQDLVRELRAKGVVLEVTEQSIDTSTASGKAFLDMLGVFAEFENNLRRERQAEGIRKAKAAGVYKGRPAKIQAARIRELLAVGRTPTEAAREMGIGRAGVYRVLGGRPREVTSEGGSAQAAGAPGLAHLNQSDPARPTPPFDVPLPKVACMAAPAAATVSVPVAVSDAA